MVLLVGRTSVRPFALAILLGIIVGGYSSPFLGHAAGELAEWRVAAAAFLRSSAKSRSCRRMNLDAVRRSRSRRSDELARCGAVVARRTCHTCRPLWTCCSLFTE